MKHPLLLATLGLAIAFAGCTDDGDGTTTTTPTGTTTTTPATTTPVTTTPVTTTPVTTTPVTTTPPTPEPYVPYDLTVLHLPTAVEAGKNFSFVLQATGGVPATSDHIGAHFGSASVPDAGANTTSYPRACVHTTVATPVPGTYNVTCSVPTAGEWFLRGHVRVGAANDSWGDEMTLIVRSAWNATGNHTLNLTGVPTLARVGQNVTMNLSMTGPTGISSHFGAHYGRNSSDAPSTTVYESGCTHQGTPTPVPTTYTVTCAFAAPGTYYLRGHLRLDEGIPPATSNYWTGEYAILVQ